MRKKIVAGNWKMHASRCEADSLMSSIKQGAQEISHADIIVFPSFVYLPMAQSLLENSPVAWGAQNLYVGSQGAFTGEVSGPMLADFGCSYVLIGHSERRILFGENAELIAAKFRAALEFGIKPLLCLGETLVERENGETEEVIRGQLESVIAAAGIEAFQQAVLAYEPVWAIGTGLTATPDQAQEVHAFIRHLLAKQDAGIANTMRILYGGSVKADNATNLFAMPDIDGGLVGGASLDAKSFLKICEACE